MIVAAALATFFASVAPASAQPGEQVPPHEDPPADPSDEPAPPEPVPGDPPEGDGPAPVRVQPTPGGMPSFDQTDPNIRAHTGLFGRGTLGFGFGSMSVSGDGPDATLSGLAVSFMLSAGYSIRPRLALHVDLGGVALANPTLEQGGVEIETDNVTAAAAGIGGGATFYLRSNAYISGSLVFSSVALTADDETVAESDPGAALSILGGKEWWFGSDLGVGVVGQIWLGRYPDSGTSDATIGVASITLNVSATYN